MSDDPNATQQVCACAGPLDGGNRPPHAADERPGSPRRRRRAGRACDLIGTLVLDGKRVPVGPCWVHQTACKTVLSWTGVDGSEKAREISGTVLRQLLDEGLLQRRDG